MKLDLIAQPFKSLDQPFLNRLAIPLTKEVPSQLLIGGAFAQQVIDDDQDTMRHRHRGTLSTPAAGNAPILGGQVGILGVSCRMGHLDQNLMKPGIAVARFA